MFRNFAKLIEDGFAHLAHESRKLDVEVRERLRNLIAYYVSQLPDFRGDSVYARLEDAGVSDEFMGGLFQQLIRMSYFKKVKENTDERYHRHLPDSEHSQNDLVF